MVVFGAGDTRACVEIPIEDDDVLEKTECFKVNYNIPEDTPGVMRSTDGPNELTVNIIENDGVLFVVLTVVCCLQCCLSTLLLKFQTSSTRYVFFSLLVFVITLELYSMDTNHCTSHSPAHSGHCIKHSPVYSGHYIKHSPVYSGHCIKQPPVYSGHSIKQPPVCSGHCIKQPPVYSGHCIKQPPVYSGHCIKQPPVYSGHCTV